MSKQRSRQARLFNKFIKMFFISFSIFVLLAALGTTAYVLIAQNNIANSLLKNPVVSQNGSETGIELSEEGSGMGKKITTMAIFGVDKDRYRTDVIMLAFFHHETAEIDIISIPRDTQVRIPDEIYARLSERRRDVSQLIRINNIPAYEAPDKRNDTSVAVIESVFGVDVDYYVNLDFTDFQNIVDAVGPIKVNIPFDMDYEAPDQGVFIHLKAGEQELNGQDAEDLVRFRSGYGNEDLGRIEMQHEFMKQFVKTLLEPKNRINMVSIVDTVLQSVTTNFKDATDYLVYVDDLSADTIHMQTIPGKAVSGGGYAYDPQATALILNKILNKEYDKEDENVKDKETNSEGASPTDETQGDTSTDTTMENAEEEVEVVVEEVLNITEITISVQNATNIPGLAGKTRDKLDQAGLIVGSVGNYQTTTKFERTVIITTKREIGDMLAGYFNSPEIRVVENVDDEADVIIAVGSNDNIE